MPPYICDEEFDDEEYEALANDIIYTFKAYGRDDIDDIDEIKAEVIDLYVSDCSITYLKTILAFFDIDIYDAMMIYVDRFGNNFKFKDKLHFYSSITYDVINNNLRNSITGDYINEEIKKYLDDSNDSNDDS